MTQQNPLRHKSPRQAVREAIEVTPEMLDAGYTALACSRDTNLVSELDSFDLSQVYIAMRRLEGGARVRFAPVGDFRDNELFTVSATTLNAVIRQSLRETFPANSSFSPTLYEQEVRHLIGGVLQTLRALRRT